jgi:uncharacterized protein
MRALASITILTIAACGGSSAPSKSNDTVSTAPARAQGVPVYRPGDAVSYKITGAGGKTIGRTHSSFKTSEDGQRQVVTRVEVDPSGEGAIQTEHATTFRTDLSPISYKRLSSSQGRYELKMGSEAIEVATDRGIQKVPKPLVRTPIVPEHDLMMLAIAIDDLRMKPGSSEILDVWSADTMDSEAWNVLAYARPEGGMTVDLPGGKALLDSSGHVDRLERGGLVYEVERPTGKPPEVRYAPPLSYEKPRSGRWEDRPFKVEVDRGSLAGVISVPLDRSTWPKKAAPIVVPISGRGDQDRHGFEGALDLGTWEMLDAIADHGFAVVRLDDRGVGASSSQVEPKDRTLELLVSDVLAVLKALESQPDLDPERVFLIGHGFGGVVAILAAGRVPVAGLILIGAPARPLIAFRAKDEAEKDRDGASGELRVKKAIAAIEGDKTAEKDLGVDYLRSYRVDRALLLDASKLNLLAEIAKVKAPAAVVQGLKDFEVSWKEDAQKLVEALKKSSGKDRVKLLAYDHVDHLMKVEPRASSVARYADRSRKLEPRFLEDLTKWLEEQAKK